jgi:ABC-type transport system involved in cytochrome bd biosynthesis fused ATPase/permease subunit
MNGLKRIAVLGAESTGKSSLTQALAGLPGGGGTPLAAGLDAARGMVEACNTQLNLGLFPEEVNAVAAVLNHDHYRFK